MNKEERELLLTTARQVAKLPTPEFTWQLLNEQIKAVEAPAAPQPEAAPAPVAQDDEAEVREWHHAIISGSADPTSPDQARAALVYHRELRAGLEETIRRRDSAIIDWRELDATNSRQINDLRARLAALERPAPEPTEEDLLEAATRGYAAHFRCTRAQAEQAMKQLSPENTWIISAREAFAVAAQRRPAIGVPKELLDRLRDAKKPSLQPAARALEWQRVALEAAEWVLTCGSQPAAPEPPDLARLVEIGKRAVPLGHATSGYAVEAIARAVLAAAHPAPADPLAPWVYRARKATRALDGMSEGSISGALALVRELAAAGGGGA